MMDLTPVVDALKPLVEVAVTAAIGVLVPAVLKRLNLANNTDLQNNLELGLQAAAGGAYKYATAHEGGLKNVAVHDGALEQAANYMVSNFPDTLNKLGITPDKVQTMVEKRLGALLAADPTVTAGPPPAAPAAPKAPVPVPAAAAPAAVPPKPTP